MKKLNNQAELKKMIRKYLSGRANPEQEAFLEAYFQHFDQQDDVFDRMSAEEKQALGEAMEMAIDQNILGPEKPKSRKLYFLIRAAAVILVVFSVGFYFYSNRNLEQPIIAGSKYKNDINPGGNKAFLTLAGGQKISLDDAGLGEVTRQGNVIITKSKDGQLIYDLSAADQTAIAAFNSIETPRGGSYQVVLPDGTKVWLNAASKLTFPTAFKGNDRKVELMGEAYFEVAKNKSKPFYVSSAGQVVQVLGTHFNISAYPDETVLKTTLLEGSVKVSKTGSGQSEILVPGQQSTIGSGGNIFIASVKANDVVAWKNGFFAFSNENITDVMKKVSRWYDVEVAFKGNMTKEGFVGAVSRFEKISEVLSALELTGLVHFKIEGRRIIVMP